MDCHYIDANRATTRRVDGLWDGMEKVGIRPDRLQLEWCSAAEGARWQEIMKQVELKRQSVTEDEVSKTRTALTETKVPNPRKSRPGDEGKIINFHCLRCGNAWTGSYHYNLERTCPTCRSNSVRVPKK